MTTKLDTHVSLKGTQTKTNKPGKAAKKQVTARLCQPVTQEHITPDTPMGATLTADGATFRVWAPNNAIAIHIRISESPHAINATGNVWQPTAETQLMRNTDDTWTGFVRDVKDGDYYRFYVAGRGQQPYKRDPYARELEIHGYPNCDCIVRDQNSYPWHDQGYRAPAFNDLVIYQFHIGRFYAADENGNDVRANRVGKFLDILDRIHYLVDLGINAIQPLPVVEFQGPYSLGYNGTDIFSPEMDYTVEPHELDLYLTKANQLLAEHGCPPLNHKDLEGQVNQMKVLIDICHLNGLAVILDVVYNHAGGFNNDDQSIYFFDRPISNNQNDSLYFTDHGHAGGLVFAYWKKEVRQFLIDNAMFFLDEYHVDGFRYDQVTVIDENGGWEFLKDLTGTLNYVKPQAINIAEYWRDDPSSVIREHERGGAGFDAVWYAGMRGAVRNAIAQASQGRDAHVSLNAIRDQLYTPSGFSASWRAVQHLENHDRQRQENDNDRELRLAALADSSNARSWYARSRSRCATGILLTSPGIPMLFMGQEFLEDKYWSDSPNANNFIWWQGLKLDKHMVDHLRFSQDMIALRRKHPALRGESINPFYVNDQDRIIAYHRWLEGIGRDVVVVASLSEDTYWYYQLGFPLAGDWLEVFNSDVYDHWVNPHVTGNAGSIFANHGPLHGLPHSANIVIPANSILVFARDRGD